jgi:hypothetical protein
MRLVTRSTLLAAVETDRLQWIVPTRLEKAGGQTIDLAQAPAPVKATIDQQAKGRAVSELEKHTDKGVTRYSVTLGLGDQKQELVVDESGRVVAAGDREEDDD